MICKPCAAAADQPQTLPPRKRRKRHPKDCGCDCQHHPAGTRQKGK